MTFPQIGAISFTENDRRLKVVIPLKRNWLLLALFTLALIVWVVMAVWIVIFLIRDVIGSGERFALVLSIMLLIWLYVWYRLGKIVWDRWQYYTADREILFINREELIVRRPVSILGITTAYDMEHVQPFYYHTKAGSAAFDYGHFRGYFGKNLSQEETNQLVAYLNRRFFPHHDEEESDR